MELWLCVNQEKMCWGDSSVSILSMNPCRFAEKELEICEIWFVKEVYIVVE